MAVWSEVMFLELQGELRLDAEYYQPELLAYEAAVKRFAGGWCILEDLCDLITDGDHMKRDYKNDGVLFLTSENFKEHYIEIKSTLYLDPEYEKTLKRARSEKNAVFLTKTGRWYGKAATCLADEPIFNISADVAKIRTKPGYDPFFLACYLNSNIGYQLVRRESTGATRDRIILDNLRSLPVPIVQGIADFESISKLIASKLEESQSLYAEAEALLLSELQLDDLDLSPGLTYEANFSEVQEAERYDAQHFEPRFINLIEHLRSKGQERTFRLDQIAPFIRRGLQPEYIDDGDVIVVNSQHLGTTLLNVEDTERTRTDLINRWSGKIHLIAR